MKPYELVAKLVQDTGKSTLQVATAMDKASFQGTLHKFIAGHVSNPARSTATKIAKYFRIPVDALYDTSVATHVAHEKGLLSGTMRASELVRPAPDTTNKVSPVRFSAITQARLAQLTPQQLEGVEAVIVAHLDALVPVRKRKQA